MEHSIQQPYGGHSTKGAFAWYAERVFAWNAERIFAWNDECTFAGITWITEASLLTWNAEYTLARNADGVDEATPVGHH